MDKSTLCRYPFDSIAIKQFDRSGNPISAWPCCMMGNNTLEEIGKGVYNPNKMHIDKFDLINSNPLQLFHHKNFQKLRDDSSNGVRNPACKICWEQEDRGIKSGRQFSVDTDLDFDKLISKPALKVIDLSINNLCNLACRMCSPSSSSLLMKDYNYFKKNNLISKVENSIERWSGDASKFSFQLRNLEQWKWLNEHASTLENLSLRLSGGEPFYNDDVIKFLDKCIAEGSSHRITLEFHTNATLFDFDLIKKLKKFNNNLNFSVDGSGKVYEYIRYPATWNQLDSSIRLYMENIHQEFYNFNFIVMATNLFNIPDFICWLKSLNKDLAVSFSEVHYPTRGVSPRSLPISLLEKSKIKIVESAIGAKIDISNLINIIDDSIKNNAENKSKLYDEILLFDLSRNQNFKDYLNDELVEWLSL